MRPDVDLVRFGIELQNQAWRISLKIYPPFTPPPADVQVYGRFDDPFDAGNDSGEAYSVLYCAQSSIAAFIEAMAGLRSRLGAVQELTAQALVSVDERDTSQTVQQSAGVVTPDWQNANHLTCTSFMTSSPVFDLTSAEAVQSLRIHLAPSLIAMGLDDLDFGELLGSNRPLTQAISRWLWTLTNKEGDPLFSGIRYRSRFDPDSICLALYQERYEVDGEVQTQPITPDTPGFAEAASILRLKIA